MSETKKWSFMEWIKPMLSRNYILILLIQTVHGLTSQMITTPISPMAKSIGISSFIIGMCASVYTGTTILARPFAGVGMDKMSKKKLLIGAFLLKAVVAIMYGLTGSVAMYVASRAVHGFVFALLGTALPAAVTAAVDKKSMGTALGVFLAFPKLVTAWGAKIAKLIYGSYGFTVAYLVVAASMVVPIILTLFVNFDESKKVAAKKKKSINIFSGISMNALPLCVMSFFIMIGYYANNLYRIVFMEERGVDITTAIAISSMLSIITRLMGGFIADRFGAKWVVGPSFAMCAVAEFILVGCNNFQTCVISCILWALGIGMYLPALQSQVFNAVPASERGAASATWFMCMDLTGLVCSPILGLICDKAGYGVCFTFAGVCVAAGLVYYLTFGQHLINKAMVRAQAEKEAKEKAEAEAAAKENA